MKVVLTTLPLLQWGLRPGVTILVLFIFLIFLDEACKLQSPEECTIPAYLQFEANVALGEKTIKLPSKPKAHTVRLPKEALRTTA